MSGKPSLLRRVLYGLRLVRLGPEWESWIEHDSAKASFIVWEAASSVVLVAITVGLIALVTGDFPAIFASTYVLVLLASLLFPGRRKFARERILTWHRRKWERGRPPAPT